MLAVRGPSDAETANVVAALSDRLEADGLAGQKTQIIINTLLAQNDAPRLSGTH